MNPMVAPSRGRGLKHDTLNGMSVTMAVAPSRGRGLKPTRPDVPDATGRVAPSRGRGLKLRGLVGVVLDFESPPHGGVD